MLAHDRDPSQSSDAGSECVPAVAAHPFVALQRAVGNRALARLAITSADLGSTGGLGKLKAVVGLSDYTKLRETLDQFHQATSIQQRTELIARMKALGARWLKANATGKSAANQDRVTRLRALLAALTQEETSLGDQASYMDRLKQGKFEWMSKWSRLGAHTTAEQLAAGRTSTRTSTVRGLDDDALDVVRQAELNEADIAAIRMYSLDDFKYVNAAMADNESWMKSSAPKMEHGGLADRLANKKMTDADWRKMAAEGREHGAMVVQALKKLPAYPRPTYRGEQLTRAQADERWTEGRMFTTPTFYSTSRNEEVASFFARHPPDAASPIKLVIEFEQQTGRDISVLSAAPENDKLAAAGVGDEEEVLLLPGTTIEVVSVDRSAKPWRVKARETSDFKIPAKMPALPALPGKV